MKSYFVALTTSSCSFLCKTKIFLLICSSVSVYPSEILKKKCQKKMQRTNLPRPLFFVIADAISSLKECKGSSQPAIAKFIEDKHTKVLPPNFRKLLSVQLKKLVKSEKLYKVKNFYKLSSATDKQTQKSTETEPKQKVGEKAKRLSQVKTHEALKKKAPTKKDAAAAVDAS
ncbi:Histone H1 [Glycine soja]|uniref:Histone H1 n=1 Tax=Glycine soja TaxID=3848 RepID=A0A445IGG6_GLYSO|nr:hypothetical protein JHK87_026517 [Glycine soja]RZB85197.1 Histone H1 [Glycine soja]